VYFKSRRSARGGDVAITDRNTILSRALTDLDCSVESIWCELFVNGGGHLLIAFDRREISFVYLDVVFGVGGCDRKRSKLCSTFDSKRERDAHS